jgi:hypothetical protein
LQFLNDEVERVGWLLEHDLLNKLAEDDVNVVLFKVLLDLIVGFDLLFSVHIKLQLLSNFIKKHHRK